MSVHLVIKMANTGGSDLPVDVDLTATVAELKEQIAGSVGLPKEHIRLVCAGRIWQDVATVGSYQPSGGAMVHCLNNPPRAEQASQQTMTAANPLQSMLGGGPAPPQAAAGGDPFSQMMAQSQQMLAQNPEMMRQLLDSPLVQQMMSNPETMRAMMRMNPQLNQLMEQRPEIARLLEDPEVLQQSMQMMQNPSLMREMQRNADRAIGQLDVMPGGHNALVRAHAEMVDPLMAALSGSGQEGAVAADMAAYAQPTEGGPNSAALPNPWGAPTAAQATTAVAPPMPTAPAMPAVPPNPIATMLQQMTGSPAMPLPMPTAQSTAPETDPIALMMRQMTSNPAMLQQSMHMAQQLGMHQGLATATPAPPAATPTLPVANTAGALPPAGIAPNPLAQMMQQALSNPAMMQQSMQMAQQMMSGGAGFPGGFGTPGVTAPAATPAEVPAAVQAAAAAASGRAGFASQLAQLSAMGFCNEFACLRALQQHQGRVDAAIDSLLASGDGAS